MINDKIDKYWEMHDKITWLDIFGADLGIILFMWVIAAVALTSMGYFVIGVLIRCDVFVIPKREETISADENPLMTVSNLRLFLLFIPVLFSFGVQWRL